MSINGVHIKALLKDIEVNTLPLAVDLSGDKASVFRLGDKSTYDVFGLTSTRLNVDNSQFWANEYGIPVNSLDISFPAAATTLGIASTSANDSGAGTGAQASGRVCRSSITKRTR